MKLADLPKYDKEPLSRRIYAICWAPFGAIWALPLWMLRTIGRILKSAVWLVCEYAAYRLTFGLGVLFFSIATIAGDASLPLFIGTLFLASVGGLALSVILSVLKRIFS